MKRLAALMLILIAVPAEARTVVIVPRATVVAKPVPRVGPAMRNAPRAKTTPTYNWWWWSTPAAPCKKGKDGKCRK